MFVQQIMEFIKSLEEINLLSDFDKGFLQDFIKKFSILPTNQRIGSQDILWIKDIYSKRWQLVFDTYCDYTRDSNLNCNQPWMRLAILLGAEEKCTPLEILIPIHASQHILYDKQIEADNEHQGLLLLFLNDKQSQFKNILTIFKHVGYHLNEDNAAVNRKRALSADALSEKNSTSAEKKRMEEKDVTNLSFMEFSRIKLKNGEYNLFGHSATYKKYWHYLEEEIIPNWLKKGMVHVELMPSLLHVISIYYLEMTNQCSKGTFRQHFLLWIKQLYTYPICDVYYLYAQEIFINNKKDYLLNLLLDCYHQDTHANCESIKTLARWLCEFDATLISDRDELNELYEQLNIGHYFKIRQLKEKLAQLKENSSESVCNHIIFLEKELQSHTEINASTIDLLAQLYQLRWSEIEGTVDDYRQSKLFINSKWIQLAQNLATHYLDLNYIQFLMPTLTPVECFELEKRKKVKKSLFYDIAGKQYANFANEIGCSINYDYRQYNEIPQYVLSELLKLIESYLLNKTDFQHMLLKWLSRFTHYDDVHVLFMQSIDVAGGKDYLGNIIFNVMISQGVDFTNQMIGIARWLSKYDASLIANSPQLSNLYDELGVGHGFQLFQLGTMIQQLISEKPSTDILNQLQVLYETMPSTSKYGDPVIFSSVIHSLLKIFHDRWLLIQHNENNYIRQPFGLNATWIRLAQLIKGAKLVEYDYYRILMPTLTVTEDVVTLEPISSYPLNHYIFSGTSFEQLILLDSSVLFFQSRKKHFLRNQVVDAQQIPEDTYWFYNCNVFPHVPLNENEHTALLFAHPKFHKYAYLTRSVTKVDESISLNTVDMLTQLVNESVFSQGLMTTEDTYSLAQEELAMKAYLKFYAFYHTLPANERRRLDSQIIYLHGKPKSFKKILNDVEKIDYPEGCVAKIGEWFIQLIFDYIPHRRLSPSIEQGTQIEMFAGYIGQAKINLAAMRMKSRKKFFFDATEFAYRAQLLCVLIIIHSSNYSRKNTHLISFFEHHNYVDSVAKKMFEALYPMLLTEDYSQYPDLIYSLREEAKEWDSEPSIFDINSFDKQIELYDSTVFIHVLLPLIKNKINDSELLQIFLDELLKIDMQSIDNDAIKMVLINIQFQKLLLNLSEITLTTIFNQLFFEKEKQFELGSVDHSLSGPRHPAILSNTSNGCVELDRNGSPEQVAGRRGSNCQQNFRELSIDYLVYRLQEFGATSPRTYNVSFFSTLINKECITQLIEDDESVQAIIERLINNLDLYCIQDSVRDNISNYLFDISTLYSKFPKTDSRP